MKAPLMATVFATALGAATPVTLAAPEDRHGGGGLPQPSTTHRAVHATYESYYLDQEEAARLPDVPESAAENPATSAGETAPVRRNGSRGGGLFGPCDLGEPWRLFPQRPGRPNVGGWLSGGAYGNTFGAPTNGPIAFRGAPKNLNLYQAWLYAEKEAETGGNLDWGYRVDYLFGIDGPYTQAFGGTGYDTGWDSSGRYGSALPQLYGQVAYGDLSVKIGHFFTIIGYEVVQAPGNFFTSIAYTFNYGEPFTHTGVLGTYKPNDDLTLYGGYTFGWDTGFEDGGNGATFLGGFSSQWTEDVLFTWTTTFGNLNQVSGGGNIFLSSIVITAQLTDEWKYVFQNDTGVQSDLPGANNNYYGVNQYLFYQASECLAYGTRFEWFRDQEGVRVGNGRAHYFEWTVGLNYRPFANFVVRPELRYDFVASPGGAVRPFDRGRSSDQLAGGFDMIFTF